MSRWPACAFTWPSSRVHLWSAARPESAYGNTMSQPSKHPPSKSIALLIAREINATPAQATSAIELLDEGATVPFIARYRKEVTGGLDDTQLRTLAERLVYLRELEARRACDSRFDPQPGQADGRTRGARSPPSRRRRSLRISICPTSRSAAPRPRSPANAGLGRWRRPFSQTARWPPPIALRPMSWVRSRT